MNKSERLKSEILKEYKSIRDFSKEIGISNSTLVSALDRDIGGMSVDKVILICERLGLDIKTFEKISSNLNDEKCADSKKCNLLNDEEIEIFAKYESLDNSGKTAVKEMLDFQYNKVKIKEEKQAIEKAKEEQATTKENDNLIDISIFPDEAKQSILHTMQVIKFAKEQPKNEHVEEKTLLTG